LLCRYDEIVRSHVLVLYGEDLFEPTAEFPLRPGDRHELYPSDDPFGDGSMPIKLGRLLDSKAGTNP
jgi:hypothetical protein